MDYISSKIRRPKFIILWFFFIISVIYITYKDEVQIYYMLLLVVQIVMLYFMFYIYKSYFQKLLMQYTLPIEITFNKLNLSFSFKTPTYENDDINKIKLLKFDAYFHNNYFNKNSQYINIDKVNKNIKHHINSVWKQALIRLKKYHLYIASILFYCFLFGLLLLFSSLISNSIIESNNYPQFLKKLYSFFTFVVFSFWLYITILILVSEAIINQNFTNQEDEIYTIYNNGGLSIKEPLKEQIQRSNEVVTTYINIGASILYISFLTVLTII